MKNFLKKILPSTFLQSYRKLRLFFKSWLFLPATVRIIANGREAQLSTRGYPTANVVLWLKTRDMMDYEPEERALLEPLFKNAKCFWDIGAQIGFYAIVAALYKVPHILAVEIDERYCEEIRRHVRANRLDIRVERAATGVSGMNVTFENYGATTTLKAVSLDDLVDITGRSPDVLKIDIDGGETATLKGAPKLLGAPAASAPAIVIEFLDAHNNIVELKSILQGYGYRLVKQSGNNTLWKK